MAITFTNGKIYRFINNKYSERRSMCTAQTRLLQEEMFAFIQIRLLM